MTRSFRDLPNQAAALLDANVVIYALTPQARFHGSCARLLERGAPAVRHLQPGVSRPAQPSHGPSAYSRGDRQLRAVRPAVLMVARPGHQPADLATYLQAAGLRPAERELAMAADLAALPLDEQLPDNLTIQRVRTARQLDDFAAIVAAGWTPPDQHVLRFYARATPALLRPDAPLWLYVGYLGMYPWRLRS